jgi:hypothetical protein
MKVFAIITAALMATAGAGYYFYTDSNCSNSSCPIAKLGGCCANGDKVQSCELPCGGCSHDCQECCDICELCCSAGAQVSTSAVSAAKPVEDEECPHCKTPANIATSAVTAGVTLK